MNLPDHFTRKTIQSTCTVWIGATNSKGYGLVVIDGREQLAHRIAYEAEHGPIPDGLVIDHLCRVRNCVRLDHLEPVTSAENNRRGRAARALQVGDTCQNGHDIREGDLYIKPSSGATECAHCRRLSNQRAGGRKRVRPTRQKRADSVREQLDRIGA